MSTYQNVHNLHTDEQCDLPPSANTAHVREERTINDVFSYLGDLFSRLTTDLGELFTLHVDLLKAEARESAKVLARDSAMLIAAAVLGWFALTGFTLALIAVVAGILPIENTMLALAAGAAIIGLVYAAIAGGLAMAGIKHLKSKSLTPDRTITEIKRDKQAVKELK